jgi:integrase
LPDQVQTDDRALIATLTYSFARITAALKMKVEDLRSRGAGWTIRLHEKGGKKHAMPCHDALAESLRAYIDPAGIAEDHKGWPFRRTARGHNGTTLSAKPMSRPDAWRMGPPACLGSRHRRAHTKPHLPCDRDLAQWRCPRTCAGTGRARESAQK